MCGFKFKLLSRLKIPNFRLFDSNILWTSKLQNLTRKSKNPKSQLLLQPKTKSPARCLAKTKFLINPSRVANVLSAKA